MDSLNPSAESLLYQEFSNIQDDLLTAIINGPTATMDFAKRFNGIYERTSQQVLAASPSDEALEHAHNAAQGISVLAESLVELEIEAHNLSEDMDSELASILGSLSINADVATSEPASKGLSLHYMRRAAPKRQFNSHVRL